MKQPPNTLPPSLFIFVVLLVSVQLSKARHKMKHRANNNFVKVPEPLSVSQYTHCIIHYVFEYDSNSLEMIICCFSVGRKIIQVCLNCRLRMAWRWRSAATWIREKKKSLTWKITLCKTKLSHDVSSCHENVFRMRFGFVFCKKKEKSNLSCFSCCHHLCLLVLHHKSV